jgi:phosphoribosyl-dephospho-CoA transferase
VTPLRRHTLVWLAHPPRACDAADTTAVQAWHARGGPWVVTRQRAEHDGLSLGLCIAEPAGRPRRIAVVADPAHVVRTAPPPPLSDLGRTVPAGAPRDLRVFGSWMWQILSGETHTHEASDLDLLIPVADRRAADDAVTMLARWPADGWPRLDGELSFPSGEVAWREYASGVPRVLLKTLEDVRLISREELP